MKMRLTEKEINDYSRDKPLVETIKGLREEIRDLNAGAMEDKVRILDSNLNGMLVPLYQKT